MKKEKETAAKERCYAQLCGRLVKTGLVLQGTITQRSIVREDPKAPGQEKAYGPYYQWTFKRQGKTVTRNLTASQATTYQKAIDRHRKMELILEEMRSLSLEILEAKTEGVRKRKSKNNQSN